MLDEYLRLLPPAQWREIRRRLERSVDDMGLAFAPPKATRRKQLPVRLSLKLRNSLGQNRVNNAARTLKRLRALLILKT